jgi:hypothetical protein
MVDLVLKLLEAIFGEKNFFSRHEYRPYTEPAEVDCA